MTIRLAPEVETRLLRKAARTGEDADTLAGTLLADVLADEASEEDLREEYRRLVALELAGTLSATQADRLQRVAQDMDALDARSPAARAMSDRLGETGRKLDEMLAILRSLPLADATP